MAFVFSASVMAALSLQALDDLDERELSVYARDALAARGLSTSRDVQITLGSSTLPLSTEWIALQPLERSQAGRLPEGPVFHAGHHDVDRHRARDQVVHRSEIGSNL